MFLEFLREIKWYLIKKKLKTIRLIILDVDGVMTDGFLYYGIEGNQLKKFSVKDGLGIRYLQKAGIEICIVSGGNGEVIKKRAQDLDIKHVYYLVKNKKEKVRYLRDKLNISKQNTLYVGDDLNDLAAKSEVGLLISTQDASKALKRHSHAILRSKGGENAIRELAGRLLANSKMMVDIEKAGFIEVNK